MIAHISAKHQCPGNWLYGHQLQPSATIRGIISAAKVSNFRYLVSMMASSVGDITRRKALAWTAFWKLKKISGEYFINLHRYQNQAFQHYLCDDAPIWTCLLHTINMENKINDLATSCYRIILGIKRLDRVRNIQIHETTNTQPLINIIRHRQRCFFGHILNECGMGPLLVLVSPCLKETVVVTCKIGSFLCSSDNLLQKNVTVFFFENQISKWCAFEKKMLFLTYFSHFLVTREKLQKFLQHISHLHTYMYFAHPVDFFCLTHFEKNTNLSGMVSLWYESWCWFLFAPFWNNQ